MKPSHRIPSILAAVVLLGACGGDEPDDVVPCTPVEPGARWTGPAGWTVTVVVTDPAPPARFTNWWTVTIDDPDGTAMTDPGAVAVSAFMPEHGHGSPVVPEVTARPDGLRVGPLDLWMPGRWEVRFVVGGDRIVIPVCLDE